MAEQLVESLAAPFEPEKYHDTYREQVIDLIEKKAAGETFEAPEQVAEAPKVVDLMAALEASVQAAKDARGRHPAAQKPKVVRAKRSAKAAEAEEAEEAPKPKRARARKSA
jgi:DNA end-binding protein Ku